MYHLFQIKEVYDWFLEIANIPDVHLSSFTLALTGWEFIKEDMLLKCDYCSRKWSLEPYLTQQIGSDKSESERPPADPVTQHQRWCAWRADMHGWESRLLQLQQLKESRSREKRSRLTSNTYVRHLYLVGHSKFITIPYFFLFFRLR